MRNSSFDELTLPCTSPSNFTSPSSENLTRQTRSPSEEGVPVIGTEIVPLPSRSISVSKVSSIRSPSEPAPASEAPTSTRSPPNALS